VYKLLVRVFDVVGRFFGGIQDIFSDGIKLGRFLAVLGILFTAAGLAGTWAISGPTPTNEDVAGQLLIVPPNVTEVRNASGEVLAGPLEEGATLRVRFGDDTYLSPDEEEVRLLDAEGAEVDWDSRDRSDGVSIRNRRTLDPGTRLVLVLDDELAAQGTPEVQSRSKGMDHIPAMAGTGLAVLAALLLFIRQERIAVVLGVAAFITLVGTRWFWFDHLSEDPEPIAVEEVEQPEEPAAVEEPPAEETPLPEGDDWLEQLEAELEAEGKLPEETEEEPTEEAGDLDWLDDLEAELEAEGVLPEEDEDEEDLALGDDLDWLLELEAELEADAPTAEAEVTVAEVILPDTLVKVVPKGSYWLWAFGLLLSLFGSLGGFIGTLEQGREKAAAFVILVVTGIVVVVEEIAERLDGIIAWLEKATIAVFMLVMAGLSFIDYLRRETPFVIEIEGGPNMATLMMVWVGFLGASLSTRRGSHLSVDATDRVLSPGAAKLAKRFTALVAGGLCWVLMGHSWALTAEHLHAGDILPGLPVWDFLVIPLNAMVALLPTAGGVGWLGAVVAGPLAWLAWGRAKKLRDQGGNQEKWGGPLMEAVSGILGGLALLCLMPMWWTPTLEDGTALAWSTVEQGDTFPLWLGAVVIPLAFGLMALRFFVAAVLGRFKKNELGGEAAIEKPFKGGQRTKKDMVLAAFLPGVLLGIGATLYFGTGGLILLTSLLLVFVGAPLFVAIGVATLACVVFLGDLSGFNVAKDMFEATKKEELLPIPFFVLAGNIMTKGSLAERLIAVARAALGRTPGGLGLATVVACAIFAAISGSSPVTVIAIGGLMYPMLVKDGYPKSYATGVLSSAGSLGIIIPPSIPMILYAIVVSLSDPAHPVAVDDLFLAGIGPGLLIAGILMVYTLFRTRPSGGVVIRTEIEGTYFGNLWKALRKGFLALMLPVLILGGIYGIFSPFGIRFTVTEAAAVSVVYALFVEVVVHREITLRKLWDVLVDSGAMMGSLFVIIVIAIAFNKFLTFQEVPQQATEWLSTIVDSKWQFLIMVNLFLLALGCVMEILSAILIVAPLLAPIAVSYGIDPIHFAIIFIVNLELGYLTPPMGINLFVSSAVFERSIVKVIRAVIPFLLLMIVALVIIVLFPQLSTFLPETLPTLFEE